MPENIEIERRFLVLTDDWKQDIIPEMRPVIMTAGYLRTDPECSVRIRLEDFRAVLTIKGDSKPGQLARPEINISLPIDKAGVILNNDSFILGKIIQKTRYDVNGPDGKLWDVDEFGGRFSGLVIAEIELQSEDEEFERPLWLGREITYDSRFSNARLALSSGNPLDSLVES